MEIVSRTFSIAGSGNTTRILTFRRLRQDCLEFKAILGYRARSNLKKKKEKTKEEEKKEGEEKEEEGEEEEVAATAAAAYPSLTFYCKINSQRTWTVNVK